MPQKKTTKPSKTFHNHMVWCVKPDVDPSSLEPPHPLIEYFHFPYVLYAVYGCCIFFFFMLNPSNLFLRATIGAAAANLCGKRDISGLGVGPPSPARRKERHQLQSGVSHLSNWKPQSDFQSSHPEESYPFPARGSAGRRGDAVGPGDCGT